MFLLELLNNIGVPGIVVSPELSLYCGDGALKLDIPLYDVNHCFGIARLVMNHGFSVSEL